MKTIILIIAISFSNLSSFSQSVCATSFKRNNGNGTCGKAGELRITFPGGCPAEAPFIDSIYAGGKKYNVVFAAPDVSFCSGPNGYIGYCIVSGNIPPITALKFFFRTASGISFNCTVIENTITLLPIKLSFFDAALNGSAVSCKWATEDDNNDHNYELQRSFDGIDFNDIAIFMIPTNAVSKIKTYAYMDNANVLQNKTMVYYRVKEVDNSGQVYYSKIITVQCGKYTNKNMVSATNPFNEEVTLTLNAEENTNAAIQIINLTGQVLATKHFNISKGLNRLVINKLGNLSKGIYILQVAINNVIASNNKLVKN